MFYIVGCVCVCVCAQSYLTLSDPMDCSPPGPLYMEFSSQDYWNMFLFPIPGDLPDPGIDPTSQALTGRFFISESLGGPSRVSAGF